MTKSPGKIQWRQPAGLSAWVVRFQACRLVVAASILAGAVLLLPPSAVGADPEPSHCLPTYRALANPPTPLLGEAVRATFHVKVSCPPEPTPLHVAIALDRSDSMAGSPFLRAEALAVSAIQGALRDDTPHARAALVTFDDAERVVVPLTRDRRRLTDMVRRAGPSRRAGRPGLRPGEDDNTRIEAGIEEALRVLRVGRQGRPRGDITEILILVSDGWSNGGCDKAVRAARDASRNSVLVIAACAGPHCHQSCMRDIAASPRYFFLDSGYSTLSGLFERIHDRIPVAPLRLFELQVSLPSHMAYVAGTAHPEPSESDPGTGRFSWREVWVPRDGVTYTVGVKPRQPGNQPVARSAEARLVDRKGREKAWSIDAPWIAVLAPHLLPTAIPMLDPPPPIGPIVPTGIASGPGR